MRRLLALLRRTRAYRLHRHQACSVTREACGGMHAYAASMRDDSLYPFWRKLVGIVTILLHPSSDFADRSLHHNF